MFDLFAVLRPNFILFVVANVYRKGSEIARHNCAVDVLDEVFAEVLFRALSGGNDIVNAYAERCVEYCGKSAVDSVALRLIAVELGVERLAYRLAYEVVEEVAHRERVELLFDKAHERLAFFTGYRMIEVVYDDIHKRFDKVGELAVSAIFAPYDVIFAVELDVAVELIARFIVKLTEVFAEFVFAYRFKHFLVHYDSADDHHHFVYFNVIYEVDECVIRPAFLGLFFARYKLAYVNVEVV